MKFRKIEIKYPIESKETECQKRSVKDYHVNNNVMIHRAETKNARKEFSRDTIKIFLTKEALGKWMDMSGSGMAVFVMPARWFTERCKRQMESFRTGYEKFPNEREGVCRVDGYLFDMEMLVLLMRSR